ncbi:hypothetical protein AGDE_14981 [Angomonas deanei]|uniref:Uncharacterized protein n=1 Tax=Angomonas deanei TaxID=59799 RepID=A0A7G2CH05_9TRYP|nr:hypothetical protein AGDE_14981 [Angomonas deanei]CAD2217482.1 hypothetical protein, conserved [Angomonas deanei]|eukprot:EPY19891.1 hypothetical protein AGDE_14981 [Angomonas deanei]
MADPDVQEYNLLLNRFKLLALAQRVAHKDLMSVIDTVGLAAFNHAGASTKIPEWNDERKPSRSLPIEKRSGAHPKTANNPSSRRELGTLYGAPREEWKQDPLSQKTTKPKRKVRRVPYDGEKAAFYERLSKPKTLVEPSSEVTYVYEEPPKETERNTPQVLKTPLPSQEENGVLSDNLTASHSPPELVHTSIRTTGVVPPPKSSDEKHGGVPPPLSMPDIERPTNDLSDSHGAGPTSARVSRGLGRGKAKPAGVPNSPSAPMEVIQHAAALLARQQLQQQQQQLAPGADHKSGRLSLQHTTQDNATSPARKHVVDTAGISGGDVATTTDGLPSVSRASINELSCAVDNMLKDHQLLLSRIAAIPDDSADKKSTTIVAAHPPVEVTDEETLDYLRGDDDEMYLVSDIMRRLNKMNGDFSKVDWRNDSVDETVHSYENGGNATVDLPIRTSKRRRGKLSQAIIDRLLEFRKENCECIAFNEKLWNSSSVSQYVFAQRLTDSLFEDCYNEVSKEVFDIMDEYVDGLVDHELQ